MKLTIITAITIGTLAERASITNDAYVPMALSFSNGSTGSCDIKKQEILGNGRNSWQPDGSPPG